MQVVFIILLVVGILGFIGLCFIFALGRIAESINNENYDYGA